MPISFVCATCGKSANLAEKFAGKKVKCKCGTVGLVPQPVADDDDLLNMDLGAVQYQAVAPPKPKATSQAAGKSGTRKLTKRQREDKALAEKLGQDWKDGPKSEYHQVDDDDKWWVFEAWDVISSGPTQAFYGYLLGSVMLIAGLQMLIWFVDWSADTGASGRAGRRLLSLPIFFLAFGSFTSIAGAIMFVRGMLDKKKRQELSKSSIGLMVGTSIVMLFVTIGSIIWLIVSR